MRNQLFITGFILLVFCGKCANAITICRSMIPIATDTQIVICGNDTAILQAGLQGDGILVWFDGSSPQTANKLAENTEKYSISGLPFGKHLFYVMEYSKDNDCYGPYVEFTVNVYPKLTVEWDASNPSTICSNASPTPIKVNASTEGTGTFTALTGVVKTSDTSALIDPKEMMEGIQNISYDFTDLNGCKSNITNTITIKKTPQPSDISMVTPSYPIAQSILFDVNGGNYQNVNWYDKEKKNVLKNGNEFYPEIPRTYTVPDSLETGYYEYLFTQTIDGCESDPAKAALTVSNCPAKAPKVENTFVCTHGEEIVLSVEAWGQGEIRWMDSQSPTRATTLAVGATYKIPAMLDPVAFTFYVYEYDSTNKCYSPATPVSVNSYPEITYTISDGGTYCDIDSIKPVKITISGGKPPYNLMYITPDANIHIVKTMGRFEIPETTPGRYEVVEISDASPGTYKAKITEKSYIDIKLLVKPNVSIIGNDTIRICKNSSTELKASGALTYNWNKISASSELVTVSPSRNTTYIVTGTDAYGCTNTASVRVLVEDLPQLSWSEPLPENVCIYGESINIAINNTSTKGGTGSFESTTGLSQTSSNSASFNPPLAGEGTKYIKYSFTDTLGCFSQIIDSIIVNKIETPQLLSISTLPFPKPNLETYFVSELNNYHVNWYDSTKTLSNTTKLSASISSTGTVPDTLIPGTSKF